MRRLVALLAVLLLPQLALAQTGNFKQIIMQDVTGAFTRFTRITTAQRDASTHNTGEVIYCTDCAPPGLWLFDGTTWVPLGGTGPGGGTGDVTGSGAIPQVAFWTGAKTIAGDGSLRWDNTTKTFTVGPTPLGPVAPGPVKVGLAAPSNSVGMQAVQVQTIQGAITPGLVTLGDDRVGISSWNFRGPGATNPIYGANFGVVFTTPGVVNGLEIDVQNGSGTNDIGQALWLNGSCVGPEAGGACNNRGNAILIDTQDGTKWFRGIHFKEGFVGGGATGTISGMGIHFERSQDSDFIAIQPRVGAASNVAIKLTNPAFTANRFELLNSGTLRVSNSMTGPAFPSYSFIEGAGPASGMYLEAVGTSGPPAGAVLGWSVNSLRRMTLGDGLTVWNFGTGADQGGTISLFDPTATHSVGFLAADFIGNSFRIRLPNVVGAAGQCVITSGGVGALGSQIETWSYGACGTGTGTGGTVTNSTVLTLNTLVVGGGGVDVKTLGSTGATTQVLHGNPGGLPTWGQVQIADIAATGTPNSTTFLRGDGQWFVPGGTGTVTTSGGPVAPQVPFYTGPTAISGDANFLWDNTLKRHTIGTANSSTSPSKALLVNSRSTGTGDPSAQFTAAFAGGSPTVNYPVPASFTADFLGGTAQPVGFGVTLELNTQDHAGAGQTIPAGFINAKITSLGPASASLNFGSVNAGVVTPWLSLDGGQALFGRKVRSQVANAIDPTGGTFIASKDFLGAALAANDGLGALIFTGENMSPAIATAAAVIQSNVDATGGTRVKGRLSFQTSDGTGLIERLRISSDGLSNFTGALAVGALPLASRQLSVVANPGGTVPLVRLETAGGVGTTARTALELVRSVTGTMAPPYGVQQDFILRDVDGVDNINARIIVGIDPATDARGTFDLQTTAQDGLATRMSINGNGQFGFSPNPVLGLGTVSFYASGTARTFLTFFTNNNANNVQLSAPTATDGGNHIWKLPTTFGAPGQALTMLDATGQWGWAAAGGASQTKFNVVVDFGAVGNGVANDAPAIQAAINAAVASGTIKSVYIPPGTYKLDSTLVMLGTTPGSFRISIVGAGYGSVLTNGAATTLIRYDAGTNGALFEHQISNLTLRANGSGITGIEFAGTATSEIYQNRVSDILFQGLAIGIHVTKTATDALPPCTLGSGETKFDWNQFTGLSFRNQPGGASPTSCIDGIRFSNGSGTGNIFSNITMLCQGNGIEWKALDPTRNIGDITVNSYQCANGGTGCLRFSPNACYRNNVTIGNSQFDGGEGDQIVMDNYSGVSIWGISWGGGGTSTLTNLGAGSMVSPGGGRIGPRFTDLGGTGTSLVQVDSTGVLSRGSAGGGSITGSGAANQVSYWAGPSILAGSPDFTFSSSTVSIGSGLTQTGRTLGVGANANPLARLESVGGSGGGARTILELVRSFNGAVSGSFGPRLDFILRDNVSGDKIAARLTAGLSGTIGTGTFAIQTDIGAGMADRLTINGVGQMFYTPSTVAGTFGLGNLGTRKTELLFFADNGTSTVGFVAPSTITGNPIWILPQTQGVAGGVLTNNGPGVPLTWSDGTTIRVALVSGTTAATGTANRSAIQTAHDTLPGEGGKIVMPSGIFCLDGTPITFTKPVVIEGQGAMNNYLTRLVAGSTTGDVFRVNSLEGVTFRWFQITNSAGLCTAVTRSGTTGAYIKTMGIVPNGDTRIDDMKFVGHVIGLDMGQAGGWRVANSYFVGSATDGAMTDIYGHNTGVDSDNGAFSIDSNTFNNGTAVGRAIYLESGGGPHIVNNSFLGHQVHLQINWGTTVNSGEINISGNHFDADQFAGIDYGILLQSQTSANIGRIRITDNNFSNHQVVSIVLATPANAQGIREVTVVGNTFLTKAGALGIEVAGERVFIGSNLFLSTGASTAISVLSSATSVQIGPNSYDFFSVPISNASTTTTLSGGVLTQAQLPGAIANGSYVGCSNCTVASPCGSGGSGGFAKRQAGAWVCN